MRYSFKTTVTPHDLDINNIASASAVLRYLQEAAYRHLKACPPTMDELRAQNKVFVLSRVSFSIYAELHSGDELEISTWPSEGKGVSFLRSGRMTRNGSTVAEHLAVWALVNPVDKTLWRTSDYDADFEYEEPIELDMPTRLRIPKDVELSLVGQYTVRYNDIDVNRHINNTHYPDILCSFIPTMLERKVVNMSVSYVNEAPLGTDIKVYCSREDDGTFYMRTILPDGRVNVEAQLIMEEVYDGIR